MNSFWSTTAVWCPNLRQKLFTGSFCCSDTCANDKTARAIKTTRIGTVEVANEAIDVVADPGCRARAGWTG
jgi:hypothetical protein